MKTTRKYIEAIAGAIGTESNVKIVEGNQWRTNIQDKVIEYDAQDLLQTDPLNAKGLLLHEVGHLNYTRDTAQSALSKEYPKTMQALYNTYEDMRIENALVTKYGEWARQGFDAIHLSGVEKQLKAMKEHGQDYSTLGKIIVDQLAREAHLKGDHSTRKALVNGIHEIESNNGVYPLNRQLENAGIRDKVRRATSTEEVKRIVDNEVYPILRDLITKEPEMPDTHGESTKGYGQTDKFSNKITALLQDNEIKALLFPYINTVSQKLNDILKEREATRFEGQFSSGKLLSRNAYKVITGEERIFSKKTTPRKPKYTITLVLDESGSMEGERHVNTYIASFLINEIAKKMGFKVNIVVYDDYVREALHLSEYRNMRGGGNRDNEAMLKVMQVTSKFDDNIVFIMTDGGVCDDPRPTLNLMYKDGYIVIAIAVGIDKEMTEQLREYYKHTVEAPSVEQLPSIMISQLQRLIHR